MLSAVLRSETAIKVSIRIMQAFVDMRRTLHAHAGKKWFGFSRFDATAFSLLDKLKRPIPP